MKDMAMVSRLKKSFDTRPVIDDLSFSIPEGRRVAIFAPSGAGKTTLIQILAGLMEPDGGRVEMNVERPVVLFQEPRLFPYMTVEENILVPFKIKKSAIGLEEQKAFNTWLSICELNNYKSHYPYQLSGGMKQKAAFIRGILQNPRFLIMDEPFQSIDRSAKKKIIRHLLDTCSEMTMLLVTHDPEEVELIADDVLCFSTHTLGKYSLLNTMEPAFSGSAGLDLELQAVI